jgi:phosphatidylserine/phosphatidylglycerophosphate/cardiolipin synthase-like enzyme/uncharacterized membrane protein YdjX (TVP38/TMEM64 family)
MRANARAEYLGEEAPRRARLCRPGDTCWVRLPAQRIAFLVDADAYYAALHDTLLAAQSRVWIVGWDVNARTRLRPDGPELGPFLDRLVRRRRSLRIHVLEWDYSVLLAPDRGLAPWIDLDWRTHPRVRFLLDDRHPLGACLHEKLVVVDDAVAFCGGLDLTVRRWDTSEHRADEPGRVDPSGRPYEPFHDVQMMVEGDVARALADRIRRRWNEVSGTSVRRLPLAGYSPWPRSVPVDVREADVAVARTEPAPADVREVERLHLEAIASARDSIYVENQYFSAASIADALAARLAEGGGPEVVLVLPSACSGWIEERTMGARRASLLQQLRDADRFSRFRCYAPHAPGIGRVNVHSKLMIVDDAFLRIGSANLANRSFGFDRECDLALEADGRSDVAAAIVKLRARLVSEHLGVAPERFEALHREHGSLVRAIDALRGGERTLAPLEPGECGSGWLALPVDPASTSERWEPLARLTPDELRDPHRRGALLGLAGTLVLALAIGIGGFAFRAAPDGLGPLLALGIALGVQLFLPVTGLLFFALWLLGPFAGGLFATTGALAGAALGWCIGRFAIGRRIERIAPARIAAFRRRLRERSVLEIMAVRLAPALPFTLGNFAAGAARVRLPEFLLGTALSLLPYWAAGAAVLVGVRAAQRQPGALSATLAALAVLGSAWALVAVRSWSRRRHAASFTA